MTKTKTGTLAPRLTTLDGARLGLPSTGKKHCDLFVGEIGELLGEQFDLASTQSWSKPSVYRFSPRRLRSAPTAEPPGFRTLPATPADTFGRVCRSRAARTLDS